MPDLRPVGCAEERDHIVAATDDNVLQPRIGSSVGGDDLLDRIRDEVLGVDASFLAVGLGVQIADLLEAVDVDDLPFHRRVGRESVEAAHHGRRDPARVGEDQRVVVAGICGNRYRGARCTNAGARTAVVLDCEREWRAAARTARADDAGVQVAGVVPRVHREVLARRTRVRGKTDHARRLGAGEHLRVEVGRTEVRRTEVRRPEVRRPEVRRPEVRRPEVRRPEVRRPEVRRPEVRRPEVRRPEVRRPEVRRPEVRGARRLRLVQRRVDRRGLERRGGELRTVDRVVRGLRGLVGQRAERRRLAGLAQILRLDVRGKDEIVVRRQRTAVRSAQRDVDLAVRSDREAIPARLVRRLDVARRARIAASVEREVARLRPDGVVRTGNRAVGELRRVARDDIGRGGSDKTTGGDRRHCCREHRLTGRYAAWIAWAASRD